MQTLEVKVNCKVEFQEIILAYLAEIGFDSFVEEGNSLFAYCEEDNFQKAEFSKLMEELSTKTPISYEINKIEEKNWNANWESSFDPIEIDDKVIIRAPFHEENREFDHELLIVPKMSFGTGHHETTEQCIRLQLDLNHHNKTVLDIGTGTGILAILAEKLGAKDVFAFDIDDWSIENVKENINLNNSKKIDFCKGTILEIPRKKYDIVIANINKNILLEELPIYRDFIAENGYLILSGFYSNDLIDIENSTEKLNLEKVKVLNKNNWVAVVFRKL